MLFYFLTTVLSIIGLSLSIQSGFFTEPVGTFLFAALIAMALSSFKQMLSHMNHVLVERRNQKRIKRVISRMHSTSRKRST